MGASTAFGGAGKAISNRNFRYYWVGNTLSILGFWLNKLALGVFTWELTASPFWLGAVGFAALFPAFALSPYTGAIADRFGMRCVSCLALLAGCAAAFGMGMYVTASGTNIGPVFSLAVLQGIALAFDLPARQGLVPFLVARGNLTSAIALNTTTFHMGAFVGPALFGLLVAFTKLYFAFFINAVTFLLFFLCLQTLKLKDRERRSGMPKSMTSKVLDGIVYTWRHPGIRSLYVMAFLPHLFVRPFIELPPGFSADVFNQGTEGVAVLAGAFGLGSFIFGVVLAFRGRTAGLAKVNVLAVFLSILCLFGFAATQVFWFAVACLFLLGMSLIAFAISNQSLIQNTVDPDKRRRVISLGTGLAVGLPAVGAVIQGGWQRCWGFSCLFWVLRLLVYPTGRGRLAASSGKLIIWNAYSDNQVMPAARKTR